MSNTKTDSQIPQRFSGEWETKRLQDISDINPQNFSSNTNPDYKFNYISLEQVDSGRLLGYSEEVFRTAPSRAQRALQNGDVLMSTVRPNLMAHLFFYGQVPNAVCSTGFAVLRAKHDSSVPYFLFSQLFSESVNNQIDKILSGSNYPAINSRDVKLIEIPCPPHVSEQRAIAEVLSDVDGLLNALDALIAKKRAIKQATMQQLLTGKTRLPGFSGAWERGILADFGVFQSGNGFPLSFQGHQSGDYPFFKVSDLSGEGNQLFMNRANHYISENVRRKLGAIRFELGSIVFAKIGAAIFLERKRLLSQESCLDNNMMAFTLTNDFSCPRFFYYIFLHIELGKLVSTTALPALSGRHIGAVSILIPPIAEQQAIASILSDMDAEITALEQRRDKTRAIKQGMMQQLLTGKVRLSESRICTDDTDDAD